MTQIRYVTGDATDPQGAGNKIIAHCCNDKGGFGKGFAGAIAHSYPLAEKNYRSWASWKRWDGMPFELGQVQFVTVACGNLLEPDFLYVANMIGQRGYRKTYDDDGIRYVDYFHLGVCLEKLRVFAIANVASVAMPRVGTGLGGGSWEVIEEIISNNLAREVDVTIYDLPA